MFVGQVCDDGHMAAPVAENLGSIFADPVAYADPWRWNAAARHIREVFGSDRPHGEGLAEPLTFSKELTAFSPDEVRVIMRDNVIDLLGGVAASE
jgi:hypothetical protein